jgi:hypothetical protein
MPSGNVTGEWDLTFSAFDPRFALEVGGDCSMSRR